MESPHLETGMKKPHLVTLILAAAFALGGFGVSPAWALPQDDDQALNQARGEAALVEARQAAGEQRWTDAVNAFRSALNYLPGNAEALQGLNHAQSMLDRGSTIQNTAQELELRRNELRVLFDNYVKEAENLLQQGNFTEAERKVLTADVELSRGRGLLQPSEFEQKQKIASDLRVRIGEARDADELIRLQQIEQDRLAEAEQRRIRQAQERERLINENLRRVRQLQQELKYEEALQVIDQILFLDELNPAALSLRDLFRLNITYREIAERNRLKEHNLANLSTEIMHSITPPAPNVSGPGLKSVSGVMQFPEDWPQITHLRLGDLGGLGMMTAADRMIVHRLNDRSLPIDFRGNTFAKVVDFFRDVTGVNVHVDWKALRFIGIDQADPVNLQLAEVPAWTAIDRVLEQLGDDFERPQMDVQDGILVISTEERLRKRTVTIVYDIRDLLFDVPYFDNAPDFSLSTTSSNGGTESVFASAVNRRAADDPGWGRGGEEEDNVFAEPNDDDDRQNRQSKVEEIIEIIQGTVDPEGWRDLGGETGTLQELNGNLIITNTPRQHAQIEGLLAQLREIRALQINVEGRFLEVSSDWFEQIGVDLDMYFNTNGGMFDQLRAVDPTAHLSDFFNSSGRLKDPVIFGGFDDVFGFDPTAPAGPAFNTVPFGNSFGTPNAAGDGIDYTFGPVGAPIRQTDGFSPIPFIQNSFNAVGELANLTPFGALAIANPALVTGLTYLDDIQVDLLIEATQADQRTVVLTAPRLTFFNGQRSFVAITRQTAYVSGLTAVTGDSSGAFVPIVDTLNEGFVLDVEGVISADRRYVTMTVIASLAQNAGFRESDAASFGGSAGGGSIFGDDDFGAAGGFEGRIELPQITLSIVQTTVSVPDKGTILLGGQRVATEVEVESGVPVLSKIPFINRFFTNRLTNKNERTLLILIRPEIIISQEHEDLLFPGLLDSVGGALSR
jgi:type II secretory pathway component GspD/PulD (secretin)/tetratricopeptide (TPR) repeat protein